MVILINLLIQMCTNIYATKSNKWFASIESIAGVRMGAVFIHIYKNNKRLCNFCFYIYCITNFERIRKAHYATKSTCINFWTNGCPILYLHSRPGKRVSIICCREKVLQTIFLASRRTTFTFPFFSFFPQIKFHLVSECKGPRCVVIVDRLRPFEEGIDRLGRVRWIARHEHAGGNDSRRKYNKAEKARNGQGETDYRWIRMCV